MRVVRWATRCKQRAVHCLAMRTNTVLTPCKQGAVHFLPVSTTFYTSFIIRRGPVLLYSHLASKVRYISYLWVQRSIHPFLLGIALSFYTHTECLAFQGMKLWISRDETVSFKGWNCEFQGMKLWVSRRGNFLKQHSCWLLAVCLFGGGGLISGWMGEVEAFFVVVEGKRFVVSPFAEEVENPILLYDC